MRGRAIARNDNHDRGTMHCYAKLNPVPAKLIWSGLLCSISSDRPHTYNILRVKPLGQRQTWLSVNYQAINFQKRKKPAGHGDDLVIREQVSMLRRSPWANLQYFKCNVLS